MNTQTQQKISRNLFSLTHCIGVLLTALSLLFDYLTVDFAYAIIHVWSIYCYYLPDTYYRFKNIGSSNSKLLEFMYIVHHVVTIMIIACCIDTKNLFILGYGCIELSNFMVYIVYHLRQIKCNHKLIALTTMLEVLIYVPIRVIGGFVFLILSSTANTTIFISFTVIYLMSIIWSIALVKQSIKLI